MTEKITSKNAVIELLRSDPSRIEKIVIDKGLKCPQDRGDGKPLPREENKVRFRA